MSYYLHTPTDEEVRGAITRFDLAWTDGGAAFDRWLAARDAAALTAAAPYIQAAALRDAADALESHWAYGCELKHDGSEDRAIASAVQMTHENAEELRARADQLEGETK